MKSPHLEYIKWVSAKVRPSFIGISVSKFIALNVFILFPLKVLTKISGKVHIFSKIISTDLAFDKVILGFFKELTLHSVLNCPNQSL